jgi:hypothetical protein
MANGRYGWNTKEASFLVRCGSPIVFMHVGGQPEKHENETNVAEFLGQSGCEKQSHQLTDDRTVPDSPWCVSIGLQP